MHCCDWFGGVVAYFIRSGLVCVCVFVVHSSERVSFRTVHHTHTHTHQSRPNKICSHTTEPITTMYFN